MVMEESNSKVEFIVFGLFCLVVVYVFMVGCGGRRGRKPPP